MLVGYTGHTYAPLIYPKAQFDLARDFAPICALGRVPQALVVNPEKINAIIQMKPPTCVCDVQRLAGCVAAISRFMSRLGEKALPFYKLLKKGDKFV